MENLLSELDKPLILREKTRKKLQEVHGELVSEEEIKNLEGEIICVGDVVTSTLLKLGKEPKIAIVDYRTKRGKYEDERIKKFGENVVKVSNPPGTITPELWKVVRKAIHSKKKWRIEVEGEEDLAVIPVVHFAPIGAIVIYGMPNTGVVMIKISDEDKKEVKEIIKEMEV